MGGCISLRFRLSEKKEEEGSSHRNKAKVISMDGQLREYAAPVEVGQVLKEEENKSLFVCNSDSLFFDELIPSLNPQQHLHPNHIYFLLSASKKEKPLCASDMAALAVKATQAIQQQQKQNKKKKKKKKKKQSQISPVVAVPDYELPEDYHHDLTVGVNKLKSKVINNNASSSSLRLRRLSSRRAKMAVRSFRLRLSTIYESSS